MAEAVVVDASVVIDLLSPGPRRQVAASAITGRGLHAPAHVDAEVLSGLARMRRAGEITAADADAAIAAMARLPAERHALSSLLQPAWAHAAYLRASDALYVALAEQLDLPVVTSDLRLARAHPRCRAVS